MLACERPHAILKRCMVLGRTAVRAGADMGRLGATCHIADRDRVHPLIEDVGEEVLDVARARNRAAHPTRDQSRPASNVGGDDPGIDSSAGQPPAPERENACEPFQSKTDES
jgi:hypothetical protein